MQKITPFLWFDDNAEEAAKFYTSIFRNSKIVSVSRYGEAASKASGRPKGSVMTVAFELEGQPFVAMNGGPAAFSFTPAISLFVNCDTQKEIDGLWEKLTDGGEAVECGWLKDKYGVSWQIVPSGIVEMISDRDPARSDRVMQAVVKMKKLDMEVLKKAYGQPQADTGGYRKKSA
ncbi:MAG: VOC family protein [Deltaproteobacteria bacterium]|nr:VOC family protein [Candidatus Deferrimicrobiaceae bacterium]